MARFFVAICFVLLGFVSAMDMPDFIHVCSRNDPNIDACITSSVEHLRPYLVTGVPEYNIPTLEPLLLKELVFPSGTGITITASNIHAFGASNFIVKRVKADFGNFVFNVDIDMPHLYVEGDYSVDGRVLLLPVTGSGPMRGNFTDCTGAVVFKAERRNDDEGIERFHVTEFKMQITVGHGNINLDNLFNGDKVLGDVVNNAINSNFEGFLQEILPLIEKALSEAFLEIGVNIVKPYTFSQLFPE